jgi:hypothetical protein
MRYFHNILQKNDNGLFSIFCFLFTVICLLIAGCAREVLPSGGPKDTAPPQVVAEKPENGSVNFHGKFIKITFDEFVTLNSPTENVIFSPPVNKRVDYTTQGKSVLVKFNDTLRSNTTYNLLFSDCIQDYHEGNKLSGYNYAFSTGDSIDNHKLSGKIRHAETGKPEAGIFVMLYEKDIDSLPLTTQPNYLTKTNSQGSFFFNHLKPQKYKIFALKDINFDFKYNLPNELIAFADSMFLAKYDENDSLIHPHSETAIMLSLFQEADTVQLLHPYINSQKGVYRFPYKIPIHSFDLQIESDTVIDFFSQLNVTNDTISLYLKTFFKDSAIVYIQRDSAETDTVELLPYKSPRNAGKAKPSTPKLNITLSNKDNLYAPTLLNFSYPIKPADSVEMFVIATLFTGKDTTSIFVNIPDSFVMQVPVSFKFEPKINYTLWFKDSLFYDYGGATNDTVMFSISKKTEKDYGNLILHYKMDQNQDTDFLVELLSSNQKVIFREVVSCSKTVEYNRLLSGIYSIKVVEDRNRNGKWDTGNYRKKEQPEKIFFIEKNIIIKGFWDIEEDIKLQTH